MMTFVIIIGALAYTLLENWTFDDAINFCIVSFSTIGYGNLSPTSVAGRIFFFFYGLLGICSIGFFIVSLRNAVIEQFQWRLAEQFSRPAHMTRVQTRMSAKDLSYPMARLEEEQRVKVMVKRKMILRMVSIWIVLWFGGAGVFCTFEQWSFLESLYFCYVTLTTIGFGDYVPMEPGSIEFWNIYVFVGLTIFAYILSLISESMISHIHLVDDEEVDEDNDLFGWEQSEDHNVPVMINDQTGSGSSGEVLGLDGLKWLTQPLNCVLFQQDAVYQQGRAQTVSKKALDRLRNRFHLVVRASNNAVHAIDTVAGSRERKCCMMHGRERDAGLLQHQKHQVGPQDQQLRHQFRCMSSAGRILKVPSKGRKQMMNAEYYATYGGPPPINTQSDHVIISGNTLHGSTDNISADMGHKDPPMGNAPAFIKFADKYSLPHQRIICRMSNKVASMSRRKSFQGSSRSTAGSPVSARSSFSNNGSGHFQPQGHVYGTAGYHDVMARRRHATLMASGETSPRDNNSDRGSKGRASIGHITYENHTDSWHNDVVEGVRDRDPHTHHDERVHQHHGSPRELQYLQTNALQHQPQVKFESPRDAVRDMVKPWESITPPGQRVLFEECHFESVRPSQQNVQLSAPEAANLQGSSQKYEQATLRSLKAPWPSKDEGISMDDNVKAMKATGESINDLETIQGSVEGIHRRKHQLSVATKVGTLSNEDPLDSTKQDSFFSFHPRQKRFPSDDPPDTQGSPAAVLEDEPPPLAQYDDIFASDEMASCALGLIPKLF
ncbi:Potassium channel [Gamsiella multidivaricata]|nr:Potassium channel [Gamsiella multidivaricata]